ncbi:hypothetical protein, unlikely [Trypanosoma brucei gambiense DAL972]|uniref:Uncharacterized protein n=1 Tax=Trypanosoma brucei gambiense (strain MHOM/CI/86/DAL972) TaxID=679716 RepID=D0A0G2_TRYB9|nr:hypothetical protein, unlikely [Trypanosoma brucei gambiense DAL972]CBH16720.1 hypothetical protein, unlikely [Trypanosoma brucei gambiense DAL972]|eukprot:XP_011778984.1 hypothetical protein, unlikely [Trypanosoma brucei gambiense DAL972]
MQNMYGISNSHISVAVHIRAWVCLPARRQRGNTCTVGKEGRKLKTSFFLFSVTEAPAKLCNSTALRTNTHTQTPTHTRLQRERHAATSNWHSPRTEQNTTHKNQRKAKRSYKQLAA